MKPNWKDAPEWANWLAMDECGQWCWHQEKPQRVDNHWESNSLTLAAKEEGPAWKYSRESRADGSN